jgi:BASS family bile acid:Na+ symporter
MLASLAHTLAMHAIAMFMLSVGLRTDRYVVRDALLHHRGHLIHAAVAVWIAVPLLTLAVLYTLRPPPYSIATLMVMAICPGVPLLLRKSDKAHGNRDTALSVLIMTVVTAVLMTPFWALILERFTPLDLKVHPRDVVLVVFPKVLLPYIVGRIIRELSPRVAKPLAKIAYGVFLAGGVVVLLALIFKHPISVRDLSVRGILASLVIALGSAVLGFYAEYRAPLEHRTAIAFAGAFGNPMLALAILARSYDFQALGFVALYVIVRVIAFIPVGLWLNHRGTTHQGPSYA